MVNDERHMALPKLYGAPAYARPPVLPSPVERPFDPDDLPLEADQTIEEQEFVTELQAAGLRPGHRGRARGRVRRRRSRGLADAPGPAFRLGSITSRFRATAGTLGGRAACRTASSWGSSSIGQSSGLISRRFQVRVLAPLPPCIGGHAAAGG